MPCQACPNSVSNGKRGSRVIQDHQAVVGVQCALQHAGARQGNSSWDGSDDVKAHTLPCGGVVHCNEALSGGPGAGSPP